MNEPWWRDSVIYQVYPRSFQSSGLTKGSGDLKGITSRLDYLLELGVDLIWISPFYQSPMKDFGYDVHDHRTIDPIFGTLDDFDELIEMAHARGLKILIDLVLSHCADTHPWFQETLKGKGSRYDDHFIWADPKSDGTPPNNWLSIFGGSAWSWSSTRRQYYLHNFLSSQPDFNFHNPEVRKELIDIARFWLNRGVDGFRLDTVNFYYHDRELRDNPPAISHDGVSIHESNPYGFQEHIYDKNNPEVPNFLEELYRLSDEYGSILTLGELGADPRRAFVLMGEYTKPGRLSLCYSFDLLTTPLTAPALRDIFRRALQDAPNAYPTWALSNHDVVRSASRFVQSKLSGSELISLSHAFLLSLNGTPCVYQGEELGLTEASIPYEQLVDPYGLEFWPDYPGRDGCRTPMPWDGALKNAGFCDENERPWLPIPDEHRSIAVNQQEADPESTLKEFQRLIRIRKHEKALCRGSFHLFDREPDASLLIYARVTKDVRALCVFNLIDSPQQLNRQDQWFVDLRVSGDPHHVYLPRTEAMAQDAPILLDGWSWQWLIFEETLS